MATPAESQVDPWGPYVNYDDVGRLQYGRLLWRNPTMRQRLLEHWQDVRHPHRERFAAQRTVVEDILSSNESDLDLDQRLRGRGLSLRVVVREIPSVFGSFF